MEVEQPREKDAGFRTGKRTDAVIKTGSQIFKGRQDDIELN
jgi:hypothetical protein